MGQMIETKQYKRGDKIVFKNMESFEVLIVHSSGYIVTNPNKNYRVPVEFFSKEFIEKAVQQKIILPEQIKTEKDKEED